MRATLPELKRPAPLAHESAAVLHGIPVIGAWPKVVHVVEETATGGRSSGFVVRHGVREMPPLVSRDEVLLTTPARTAVDLARTRSFASGLAAADYVLAAGLATIDELDAELVRGARRPGQARARLAVEHADARAESVGESLSRARMIELDVPRPELQQSFYDADGYIGRTDFWWPELKIVGEFDGKVKFGRAIGGDEASTREALCREKQREDRLRRLGLGVVRWIWSEALDQRTLARLLGNGGIR